MGLFGGDASQKTTTDVKNINQTDNEAAAFGGFDSSPIVTETDPFTFVAAGKGKNQFKYSEDNSLRQNIKITQVDPGALEAFSKSADVTLAALTTLEKNSASSLDAIKSFAESQNKSLTDFVQQSESPDKELFSDNVKILVLASLVGLALVTS